MTSPSPCPAGYPAQAPAPHTGLIQQYEAIYFQRGRRHVARRGERLVLSARDNQELARLAQLLWEHYRRQPHERYVTAMWLRRTVLHQQGRDGDVYNGCDAVEWCREARLLGLIQVQ